MTEAERVLAGPTAPYAFILLWRGGDPQRNDFGTAKGLPAEKRSMFATSDGSCCWYRQNAAAVLTMNRVIVVNLQCAVGTFETNLAGSEDSLQEPQKQSDTNYHDDHGQKPATWTKQSDVTKAGRCQRRDRKIKGVDVCSDLGVDVMLRYVNERRHDHDEHGEV